MALADQVAGHRLGLLNPTLYNLLPGYIPMPHAHEHETLNDFVVADAAVNGFWGNMRSYLVSLLKAWWGEAATEQNDYCFEYLPRLTGDHSSYPTVMRQIDQGGGGYFLVGENPAVGSANAKLQRLGLANIDWLVVRDFSLIESATWWKDGPEIETGELVTEENGTEVFFLPAAAHTEKSGSFTNTQRLLQWRDLQILKRAESTCANRTHVRKSREADHHSGQPPDRDDRCHVQRRAR